MNLIYYNQFFWTLALVLGYILWIQFSKQVFLNFSILDTILIFLLVFNLGFIGAKLASILEGLILKKEYLQSRDIISHSGGRIYGSILMVFLSFIVYYAISKKDNTLKILDLIALIFCLAKGIGDIGCQFSGDGCYGIPTCLPWGMNYDWGMKPAGYMAHPTPMYNLIFHTLFFFVLLRLYRYKLFAGQISAVYLCGIGLYHFFLELIRVNLPIWGPFSLSHFFYFAFFIASFPLYFWFKKIGHSYNQVST